MTHYSTSEKSSNTSGRFGSARNRNGAPAGRNAHRRGQSFGDFHFPAFGSISAETWVDIVCISILAIFLISVFCCWDAFLDALFINILFPIISVCASLLGVIIGIGAVIAIFYAMFHRPRRWYW